MTMKRRLAALLTTPVAFTILIVSMTAGTANERTLFDFHTAAQSSSWKVVNDGVMGGVSTSRFEAPVGGGAVFSGTVRLENNGGFASVRSGAPVGDLSDYNVFVLRVRGDGRRYKFTVRTGTSFDAPLYQCAFATARGKWEEHRLEFTRFMPTFRGRVLRDAPPLDPKTIQSIGFLISDNQAGPFRLEIGCVRASPASKDP